jgi:hypothetical protein
MSLGIDLQLQYGANFKTSFVIYSDPRMELWRGEWEPWRIYEEGEAVEWRNQAYVALLTTEHAEPGSPGAQPFWSPMVEAELTGSVVTLTVEGVVTEKALATEKGKVTIELVPTEFTNAPSSAHYYVKLKDAANVTSYPIIGTALFRKP